MTAERFWQAALKPFHLSTVRSLERFSGRGEPAHSTERYVLADLWVSRATSDALRSLGEQHQLPLDVIIQGGWSLLLSHHSDQDRVVFGGSLSSQDASSAPTLLPVSVKVHLAEPLIPWLRRIQSWSDEAARYLPVTLEQIRAWCNFPEDQQIFESVFLGQGALLPGSLIAAMDGGQKDVSVPEPLKEYPLLVLFALRQELCLRVLYDSARFDEESVERLLDHLQRLLSEFAANPNGRLAKFALLGEEERQVLLEEWNATQTPYPQDRCIHELIEAQVRKTPDAPAIFFEDQGLTYQELDQRANALAHRLQQLGVGPDVVVGLYMERSLELLVAMLGILKAGGAYVPLDPAYPANRLTLMLEEARVRVIITQPWLQREIAHHSLPIISLEKAPSGERIGEALPPPSLVKPGNLAYIIYTSGSTGRPKGVMVTHRNVVNLFTGMDENLQLEPPMTWLATTRMSFDVSVFELLWTLSRGCAVVIQAEHTKAAYTAVPPKTLELLERKFLKYEEVDLSEIPDDLLYSLPAQMLRYGVTHLQCTPSMARLLTFDSETTRILRNLQRIQLAGEALSLHFVEQLRRLLPTTTIYNLYGPTEATVFASFHRVEKVPGETTISIGRPIANTNFYILDSHLRPVPLGMAGELYIGGNGIVRGYINQPDVTAARFVPDPFRGEGARLYRTGDLVRYLPDGAVEFLNRVDFQVKIHGFRIELGEIETALLQHPSVREAVVVARQGPATSSQVWKESDLRILGGFRRRGASTGNKSAKQSHLAGTEDEGQKHLVAYLVLQERDRPVAQLVQELRAMVRESLPEYMMPAFFMVLDRFPMTTSGKIDRQRLPAPAMTRPALVVPYVAPQTPLQATLARLWEQVLHLEQIGIEDNFFDLGGDSILSLQVVTRARQQGLVLSPRLLFRWQTIAALAQALEQESAQAPAQEREEERAEVGERPAGVTKLQRWYLSQRWVQPERWVEWVLLEAREPLEAERVQAALQAVVARLPVLGRRFWLAEEGWQVGEGAGAVEVQVQPMEKWETEREEVLGRVVEGLEVEAGRLGAAVLWEEGGGVRWVQVVWARLVVEEVGWSAIEEALEQSTGQAVRALAEGASRSEKPSETVEQEGARAGKRWRERVEEEVLPRLHARWSEVVVWVVGQVVGEREGKGRVEVEVKAGGRRSRRGWEGEVRRVEVKAGGSLREVKEQLRAGKEPEGEAGGAGGAGGAAGAGRLLVEVEEAEEERRETEGWWRERARGQAGWGGVRGRGQRVWVRRRGEGVEVEWEGGEGGRGRGEEVKRRLEEIEAEGVEAEEALTVTDFPEAELSPADLATLLSTLQ